MNAIPNTYRLGLEPLNRINDSMCGKHISASSELASMRMRSILRRVSRPVNTVAFLASLIALDTLDIFCDSIKEISKIGKGIVEFIFVVIRNENVPTSAAKAGNEEQFPIVRRHVGKTILNHTTSDIPLVSRSGNSSEMLYATLCASGLNLDHYMLLSSSISNSSRAEGLELFSMKSIIS